MDKSRLTPIIAGRSQNPSPEPVRLPQGSAGIVASMKTQSTASAHSAQALLRLQKHCGNHLVQRLLSEKKAKQAPLVGRHRAAKPMLVQRSVLSDELEEIWITQGRAAFFRRLANLQQTDTDVRDFIETYLRGADLRRARAIYRLPTPVNDAGALPRVSLACLLRMYATCSRRFAPPELGGSVYTRQWIYSSEGSGLIREAIRSKLQYHVRNSTPRAVRCMISRLLCRTRGNAQRRRELCLLANDVLAAPGWRATDQIPITHGMPATDRRYARLWNSKGGLFANLARRLDPRIPPYVAAGVMAAETGQRFYERGRAIIRFEAHVFRSRWANTSAARRRLFQQHFRTSRPHRWRAGTRGAFQRYHGNQSSEWRVLDFARSLDTLANTKAIESTSFGAGQTMGFNYRRVGYTSPEEMVRHYQTSERAQIAGIFEYIATIQPVARRNRVINAMVRNNFLPLSQAYGPRDPQAHARRIAGAVRRMRRLVEAARRRAAGGAGGR
ncbi:MAG: N-acetylmuramidase domain-containing protein [Gammaproteobacteria bacterium]